MEGIISSGNTESPTLKPSREAPTLPLFPGVPTVPPGNFSSPTINPGTVLIQTDTSRPSSTAKPVSASPFSSSPSASSKKTTSRPTSRPVSTLHPTTYVPSEKPTSKPAAGKPTKKSTPVPTKLTTSSPSLVTSSPVGKTPTQKPSSVSTTTRGPTSISPTAGTPSKKPTSGPASLVKTLSPTPKTTSEGPTFATNHPTNSKTSSPSSKSLAPSTALPTHKPSTDSPAHVSVKPTSKLTSSAPSTASSTHAPSLFPTVQGMTKAPTKIKTLAPVVRAPTGIKTDAPAAHSPTATKAPVSLHTTAPTGLPPKVKLSALGIASAEWGLPWELGVVYELLANGAVRSSTKLYAGDLGAIVGAAACLGGSSGLRALRSAWEPIVAKCSKTNCDGFYAGLFRKALAGVGQNAKACYGSLFARVKLLDCVHGSKSFVPTLVTHYATVPGVVGTAIGSSWRSTWGSEMPSCTSPNLPTGNSAILDATGAATPCGSATSCIAIGLSKGPSGESIYPGMSSTTWDEAKWQLAISSASEFVKQGFDTLTLFQQGRADARFFLSNLG